MTKDIFINRTIEMIKQCECTDYENMITGFKLRIEKNNIKSITVTVQVLLIFEQLFGSNFMFNNKIRSLFNFGNIKRYLLQKKKDFLEIDKEHYSQINVNRCAYCGIGLLLLKEEAAANDIANLLCNNRINNEFAWGLKLTESVPDILPTYTTTMLLNRLHREFIRPSFIDTIMKKCDGTGIPYNCEYDYKYVEALTLVLYMDKYYYFKTIDSEKLKILNNYYYSGIDSIWDAKEAFFQEHPINQWRIYGFGLAANLVAKLNNPFYDSVLEHLIDAFDKPQTNISYVLEICRMYNAIIKNRDPFMQDRLLEEVTEIGSNCTYFRAQQNISIEQLNNMVDKLTIIENKIDKMHEYNREITIKIPIATAFICIYFIVIGGISYLFINTFLSRVFKINNSNDLYEMIDLGISSIIPVIGFISKKTRLFILKGVNKFYNTFNIVRTEDKNKEN